MKKQLLVAGTVATIGLTTATGLGIASAATSSGHDGSDIVSKLATKFHLNKDDVQKVFDEDRQAHEAEHQQAMQDRLAQAVKDGKLTQEQADKITAKLKEMKADMDTERANMDSKTPEERHATMEAKRSELQKWAQENNIPQEYLMFGRGGGMHGHDHSPGMMDQSSQTSAANNS